MLESTDLNLRNPIRFIEKKKLTISNQLNHFSKFFSNFIDFKWTDKKDLSY